MAIQVGALANGVEQGAQGAMNLGEQAQQLAAKRDLGNSILAAMNTQTQTDPNAAPASPAPAQPAAPASQQPAQQPQQPQQADQQPAQQSPSQSPVSQPQGQLKLVAQSEPDIKNQALPGLEKEYQAAGGSGPKPAATMDAGARTTVGDTANPTNPTSPDPQATGNPAAQERSFPLVDPRPLARLQQADPTIYKTVLLASQETGVSPERIAAHMQVESGFRQTDKNGQLLTSNTGAQGLMQLEPETARAYSMNGQLDASNPVDNVRIGAHYLADLDAHLGKDSVASRVAYFTGEQGYQKFQEYASTHTPAETESAYPKTMDYVRKMAPFSQVSAQDLAQHQGGGAMNPQQILQAAQNGPQGLLGYLVQTKGSDVPLSDAWGNAERALVNNRVWAGDMAGVQHAHDFILNMSHAGFNQSLVQAGQALQAGDGVGAAKALAQAHAFFPDGAMGQFGVDQAGHVWGQRMDPANPAQTIGQPFQVTPNALMGLFNQSTDPKQYLDELYKQRQLVSQEAHSSALNDYYKDQITGREQVAETNAKAKTDAAQTAADSRVTAADIRAAGRSGTGPQASFYKGVEKEVNDNYGPDVMAKASPNDLGLLADIHTSARENGANSLRARQAALGLRDQSLKVRDAGNGTYGVVDPKKPDAPPIAYISSDVVQKLTGGKPVTPPAGGPAIQIGSHPSPLAGAPTLAGTGQSSAVPAQPQGAVNTGSFGPPSNQQMWQQQQQAAATP